MNYSILWDLTHGKDSEWEEDSDFSRPDFLLDLNLDQVLAKVLDQRKDYDLKRYYYELPKQKETISYRQAVFQDLEKDDLYEGMLGFSEEMRITREFEEYSKKSIDDLQKKRWHLDSAYHYCNAVKSLYRCLEEGGPESQGLKMLKDLIKQRMDSEGFCNLDEATDRLRQQFDQIRVNVELTPGKMVISQEVPEENYLDRLAALFPDARNIPRNVENPFANVLKLSVFEGKLLEVWKKNIPEAFIRLHEFYKRHKEFIEPLLLRLEQEVQFYIAFHMYKKKMVSLGCFFGMPTVGKGRFQVKDAYDLALSWSINSRNSYMGNRSLEEKVVSNDAYYEEKERFFVVTGPNQGGKTTFARSIGQVAYFGLIGLPAPCMSAEIPMFTGILTHFSVEESIDTGKGKLKEELTRLQPMMRHLNQNKFVIINELFTTAATYDAYVMGRRVMKHFVESGCYGVYVTHIQELAKESEAVVSLVAELDSEDKRKRTFKIMRRKAMEGGYANDIVDRYHLSYEEVKGRLEDIPVIQ